MVFQQGSRYCLGEFTVRGIRRGTGGGTLLGPHFPTPYTVDEVAENTAFLLQDGHVMLTMRPFLVIPTLRERACRWVQWANEHPESVRNVMQDPKRPEEWPGL
ncbi:hypothetical protein [uncultured Flavonifractor sp.]|uniref:hypothetical protein n=1 Tax=uncultured Flavonifractor sp. TaxID=1193534 RepID=UPI0025973FAF|nr:hypothetical protein [uncultured Flavonifractor sp.]